MRPPASHVEVLELSRQAEGLFAAAFRVTHGLGVPELTYVADVFDKEHGGAIAQASRVICEACRKVAMTGRPMHQLLERADYPTLVVAALPFIGTDQVVAAFGVIFFAEDEGDCLRRMAALQAAVRA